MLRSHNVMKSVDAYEAKQMFKDAFEEWFSQEPYEIQVTAFLAIFRKIS